VSRMRIVKDVVREGRSRSHSNVSAGSGNSSRTGTGITVENSQQFEDGPHLEDRFDVGEVVMANREGSGEWVKCKIVRKRFNGTFDVLHGDEYTEIFVTRSNLSLVPAS
jgi:hypothetical protein